MKISIIAAIDKNNALGLNNRLLWHLSADLKRFKQLTTDHYIILGRKTFEAIGKPLPKRVNIILTKQANYKAPNCLFAKSLSEALRLAENQPEVFICGGGEVYSEAIEIAHYLYITHINAAFDADTFFPEIKPKLWSIVSKEDNFCEKNNFEYSFVNYVRKI